MEIQNPVWEVSPPEFPQAVSSMRGCFGSGPERGEVQKADKEHLS